MKRTQASSSRSGTRTSTRSSSRSTSAENETKKGAAPPPPERPKRPPVPRSPAKRMNEKTIAEARQRSEEQRRQTIKQLAEQEYQARGTIREGIIDATMLRFVTRSELEGDAIAVCEITRPDLDLSDPNNLAGTLYDPRMGPYDYNGACNSCRNVGLKCSSHYGKIMFRRPNESGELVPNPIYNPLYLPILIQVLNCVCADCGNLMIPAERAKEMGIMNYSRGKRLRKYSEESQKVKHCTSSETCGVHRFYGRSKADSGLIMRFKDKKKDEPEPIYPEKAYEILHAMSDNDVNALGFTVGRPEDTLIFYGILVTPPITRVPRTIGDSIQTDDITERYRTIIVANEDIKRQKFPRNINNPDPEVRNVLISKYFYEKSRSLSEKVASIVKSTNSNGAKRPIGCLYTIVSGKKGVFRSFLSAKIGDYCARAVASPGIGLKTDEVGVPVEFASKLTPMEIAFQAKDVNGIVHGNIDTLQKLLEEGKVVRVERKEVSIAIAPNQRSGDNKFIIESGDKVYRYLRDGDGILVNRNPSLHRQSIMYHRVKLIPNLSIQLPLPTTTPYNADFDGDEINLFLVQDPQARAEAQLIMTVGESLLSESNGMALVAPTFNAPLGIYLMTLPRTHLKMTDLFDIWFATRSTPEAKQKNFTSELGDYLDRCRKHGVNPLAGKSIFSIILPRDLNYHTELSKPVKSFLKYKVETIFKGGESKIIYSNQLAESSINYSKIELEKLKSKFSAYEIPDHYDFSVKIIETPFFEKVYEEGTPEEYKIIISTVESLEQEVMIRDGILISGTLTKGNIGHGGDLLTYFYREYNPAMSLILVDSIDYIANWYLQSQYAYSIGIDDMFDVDTVQKYSQKFQEEMEKVFKKVGLIAKPVSSELEELKRQANVIDLLSKLNELSFTLTTGADSGYPSSNIRHAIQSGAKGKAENLAGSLMSIGLQLKQGSLISPAYGQSRSSPFFPENVYVPEAIGFCRHSLSEGFTPAEALSIASSARGDLVTMKLGTPISGYTQRRLANLMGNLVTASDGSVVNGTGKGFAMVQSIYGDCGFEPKSLYRINSDKGEYLSPINMRQLAFQ